MKFSKQMEASMIQEWRDAYLDYKALKKQLDDIVAMRARSSPHAQGSSPWLTRMISPTSSPRARASSLTGDPLRDWKDALEAGVTRAMKFVEQCLQHVESKLAEIETHCNEIFSAPGSDAATSNKKMELRVLKVLSAKAEKAHNLRNFVELNHVALFKILKKYDKRMNTKEGLSEMFPQLVKDSGLGDYTRLNKVDAEIRRLSLLSDRLHGLGSICSPAILNMAVGVGAVPAKHDVAQQQALFFFLGTSVGLMIGILVLICIPPTESEEREFSAAYFLAPFSVFRVGLSLCLCLWGIGFVMLVCEAHGINYAYLLGFDLRPRAGPNFFFARAAVLTSVWIVVFGMYVVDYKWLMLSDLGASRGFNGRSSWHYVCYPAILVMAIGIGLLMPSKFAGLRDKRGLCEAIGRTVLAPCFAVSFPDNVIGDVLTSLVKPMQDIPPMICYFASSHPQTRINVDKFVERGDTCPEWVDVVCKTLLAALPLWFRAWQCVRRYCDTKESRHVWNLGKYTCAFIVVVVAVFCVERKEYVLPLQVVATAYAAVWDIGLDWGINPCDMFSFRTLGRSVSTREWAGDAPRTDRLQNRASARLKDRSFHACTYVAASIFDILARLTWVQTLVPIHFLTTDVINREIVVVLLSGIEIARRCVWAILRLEYEQHTNASAYRAILWVPDMFQPTVEADGDCAEDIERPARLCNGLLDHSCSDISAASAAEGNDSTSFCLRAAQPLLHGRAEHSGSSSGSGRPIDEALEMGCTTGKDLDSEVRISSATAPPESSTAAANSIAATSQADPSTS